MSQRIEQASRDTAPAGSIRFNTDSAKMEIYNGEAWWEIDATSPEKHTGGTRGLLAGNNVTPADTTGNTIEFINVSSTGNATNFGDRIGGGRRQIAAMADRSRAVFAGSYSPMGNTIDFVTIASTGNAQDFGDTLSSGTNSVLTECTGVSSSTRGLMCGGRQPGQVDVISYVTIQSTGNAIDFGNLLEVKRNCGSFQSPTRGVIVGGRDNPGTSIKDIEFVTISTLGNSTDFGDLSTAGGEANMGGSNAIRGIVAGGVPSTNAIEFVTIATLGNSADFGDNLAAFSGGMNTMACSRTRAVMFGANSPARDLAYVEIMSKGNSLEFGDFADSDFATTSYASGCSNGHGGLG